jgi:hypothetical protein
MKKFLLGVILGAILGTAAGFAIGVFVFPYLFPPPPVHEMVSGKTEQDVLATGQFIHANPSDPVHYGRGALTLYEDLLHLEADFEVGPGPKYHVYLVPEADINPDTPVQQTMFVDLGRLKAFSGSQNYPVPDGLDLAQYPSVVIWCEQFDVLISPAALRFRP